MCACAGFGSLSLTHMLAIRVVGDVCLLAVVAAYLKSPELVGRLHDLGGEPTPMTSAQFKTFIQTESARFAKLVESGALP